MLTQQKREQLKKVVNDDAIKKIKSAMNEIGKFEDSGFINEFETYYSAAISDKSEPVIFDKNGKHIRKIFPQMPREPLVKKYKLV